MQILFVGKANINSPKGRVKTESQNRKRCEPLLGHARSARKGAKSMGGAVRRPPNNSLKAQKSDSGARGETRTPMALLPADFKSAASTNSATRAELEFRI